MAGLRSFNRVLSNSDGEEDPFVLRAVHGGRAAGEGPASAGLGGRLAARFKGSKPRPLGTRSANPDGGGDAADPRQRAIVKIHYYKHAGGGGAALRAHGGYIEREGAKLVQESDPHADYLSRDGRHGFYGPEQNGIDGRAQLAEWSKADGRHFRIILSPENGQAIGDLAGYTREVMARAEAELARPLQWIAVNHWDTDNPHTHIVLRGRDGAGKPLSLPDNFIKHRVREIARDAATERLGARTPSDQRRALDREVRAHRPIRLDQRIAARLDPAGRVRMAQLGDGAGGPEIVAAMKTRLVELSRLGLAQEGHRGEFTLVPDWQARLRALEQHIDIRRSRFAQAREATSTKPVAMDLRRSPAPKAQGAHSEAIRRAGDELSRDTGKPYRELGAKTQHWTVRGQVNLPKGQHLKLERHDRVTLAPKPSGLDVAAGQKVLVSTAQVTKALGIDR
jgi:hypothetical protein